MKQLPNETYDQFKERRQAENERIDSSLGWRTFWSADRGTYVRNQPSVAERPKRQPKAKERKRKRICGRDKRRAKANIL